MFYLIITSLIIPSILISLGVGILFNLLSWDVHWSTSGLGAQLTWSIPFGLLIMFAVFNRFDERYEEAAGTKSMGGAKILFVNPNSTDSMTEKVRTTATSLLPDEVIVDAVTKG